MIMINEAVNAQSQGDDGVFEKEFLPYVIRTGRITNVLGVVCSFVPGLVLLVVFGIAPPLAAVAAAFVAIASAVGMLWFIEPISYFPVIGVAGTFMAFLTGNISNLRVPCATVSQKVAGVEPGTKEGGIIATLGMAVSVLVNTLILTLGVFFGSYLLTKMPAGVNAALGTYLLPSLFGALFMQFALSRWKIAPIALALALGLTIFLGTVIPSAFITLGVVFGTIFISMVLYSKKLI